MIWTGGGGNSQHIFNGIIDIIAGRGNVDGRCSTAQHVYGRSPVTVAGTVVVEEDLVEGPR